MKLYNVYRLCKQNITFLENAYAIKNDKVGVFVIYNWILIKHHLDHIKKIPSFRKYVNDYINSVPVLVREHVSPQIDPSTAGKINANLKVIINKMNTIIELYESMKISSGGNGIDIKMPSCEYLDDYITYLQEINFVFTQCPFLQCDGEVLKFESVDVGSNWLKLTIATSATCILLNNTAALVDKALVLHSHYVSIQQQEEMLKSLQLKNELTKEQIETYNLLRNTYMDAAISLLENDLGKLRDPEERDRAKRSLDKLEQLLGKGCEIYATLDSPEEVQALFPEIQSNLELSDDIIKYLEDKEEKPD